jgi:hypothetical protein
MEFQTDAAQQMLQAVMIQLVLLKVPAVPPPISALSRTIQWSAVQTLKTAAQPMNHTSAALLCLATLVAPPKTSAAQTAA